MIAVDDYLDDIAATRIVRDRIALFRRRFETLLPNAKLPHVFISEIRDAEGLRLWQSLWFIGDSYMIEAREFLSSDDFDGVALPGIDRWHLILEDYDINEQPSEKSRLSLKLSLQGPGGSYSNLSATFKATGANCSHLLDLFHSVFRPHITGSGG